MAADSGMSLRQLAKGLGVSQPFLSQIRSEKRPMPSALKERVKALGAYHLLIGDKQIYEFPGDEGAGQEKRPPAKMASSLDIEASYVGGSARESNPPTPLVTRHNGFEVRRSHRAPSTPPKLYVR